MGKIVFLLPASKQTTCCRNAPRAQLGQEGLPHLLCGNTSVTTGLQRMLVFMATGSCRHNFAPAILVGQITAFLIDPWNSMPWDACVVSTNNCVWFKKAPFAGQADTIPDIASLWKSAMPWVRKTSYPLKCPSFGHETASWSCPGTISNIVVQLRRKPGPFRFNLVLSNGCARGFVQGLALTPQSQQVGTTDGKLAGNRGLWALLCTALLCNFSEMQPMAPADERKLSNEDFLYFFCQGNQSLKKCIKIC